MVEARARAGRGRQVNVNVNVKGQREGFDDPAYAAEWAPPSELDEALSVCLLVMDLRHVQVYSSCCTCSVFK